MPKTYCSLAKLIKDSATTGTVSVSDMLYVAGASGKMTNTGRYIEYGYTVEYDHSSGYNPDYPNVYDLVVSVYKTKESNGTQVDDFVNRIKISVGSVSQLH